MIFGFSMQKRLFQSFASIKSMKKHIITAPMREMAKQPLTLRYSYTFARDKIFRSKKITSICYFRSVVN
jgi:hypothetical protein